MDHASFIVALPASKQVELQKTTDRPGLIHLAIHGGSIAVLIGLIVGKVPFWPLLIPVLGIFYAGLFMLQHECTHKTPFQTQTLNEIVGWVTGIVLFQPFIWFRYFHLAHHRHTNDPERDPELAGGSKPTTLGQYIFHISTLGYWRAKIAVLFSSAFGSIDDTFIPESAKPKIGREARLYLTVYAVAFAVSVWLSAILFWIWLLPVAVGFPFLRLYLLAEHGHCPPVADMFENTRTTFTNRIIRFLAWNMPYHAEHHALPNVPFHKLPELHRLCAAHLKSTSDGYCSFQRDYIRELSGVSNSHENVKS